MRFTDKQLRVIRREIASITQEHYRTWGYGLGQDNSLTEDEMHAINTDLDNLIIECLDKHTKMYNIDKSSFRYLNIDTMTYTD